MNKILLITVNYQNSRVTQTLIHSLGKVKNLEDVSLVVLDNGSSATSKKELEEIRSGSPLPFQILSSRKNLYYWGGAAYVLDYLKLDFSRNPDWIMVCNNDIYIEQKDFFTRLLALDPTHYPVIAPEIVSSSSQKSLNPFLIHPISRTMDIYYRLYYWSPFTAEAVHCLGRRIRILSSMMKKDRSASHGGKIYAPHGACVIFSRYFFQKGGYLDTGFRFFGEEISTAEIARRLGLPIHFIPELRVIHDEHTSLKETSWKTVFHHSRQSYLYLKKKYRTL